MSIARAAALPMLVVACAHEPARASPPPPPMAIAPIALSADAAPPAKPAPPPPPMHLVAAAPTELVHFDVDAGAFVPPAGAFGVARDANGEEVSMTFARSVAACAKDPGAVWVKITLRPEPKVTDTDAPPAVAQCVLALLAHDKTWRTLETVEVDVVLRRKP